MDALKAELARKRKAVKEDFGGRKFVRRGEIDQRELDRRKEEEKKELLEKQKRKAAATGAGQDPVVGSDANAAVNPELSSEAKETGNAHEIDELVLSKDEVIKRLRYLKQPVTLFGEDDDARAARLKALMKTGEIDSELMEGQRNDFLMDMAELRMLQKHGRLEPRKEKTKEKEPDGDKDGGGGGEENITGEGGFSSGIENDKDVKRLRANFDDLSDEDKILVFFKRLLLEWEEELANRPEAERRTGRGKSSVATFKQCARYLKPLFKMCRKKMLPDDIRTALMIVVNKCMERDYLTAMDQYIKLAIGNAPWPIGVTMVGIHERSAREKIYTNSVAHIMNDETTRKYLQSIKRLMTLCQRRYPSMPSKSVEFNSLANGSDLQSLLTEERARTGSVQADERLRLMAARDEDSL